MVSKYTPRPDWKPPHTCPGCNTEVHYHNRTDENSSVNQGRKACKYCRQWFHRNCLLGGLACMNCFESCADKEIRSILLEDAHNIVNGREFTKSHQDESRDIVAVQLWMLFRTEYRLDEKRVASVMRFPLSWVTKTFQIMRDKGVLNPEGQVCLDVSDENPLTLYVALVLNSLLVQGMVDRKKDETYSSS